MGEGDSMAYRQFMCAMAVLVHERILCYPSQSLLCTSAAHYIIDGRFLVHTWIKFYECKLLL